ncbi:MAG: hypothetical protein NT166_06765 [Candidatus Aminicenantes bacterium]|nr:hypothetical protein [Candidatus Aminicenantes bacterium]
MNDLILNELSYPFKNKYDAIAGIKTFIETFGAASTLGLTRLRIHENIGKKLYRLEIAPGYYVSDWLNSPCDQQTAAGETAKKEASPFDLRNRFREITANAPFITDYEPIEKEEFDRSSFEIALSGGETKAAEGLGTAFLLDTIAMSFLSGSFWDTCKIERLKRYVIKEDGGDYEEFVEVRHVSRPAHIETHRQWSDKKKRESLKTAGDLWDRREEFFPHLVLCGSIEQQLKTIIGIGSSYFNQLIDRLKLLDAYAKNWTSGSFSESEVKKSYGLDVSGESPYTMKKYGNQRRFRLPDGRKEYFEMHIKTGQLRFHFFPDEETHRIYVGYIGPHLRTITD